MVFLLRQYASWSRYNDVEREFVFKNGGKYTESVKQEFRNLFADTRERHRDTARDLVSKFREIASIQDVPSPECSCVLFQGALDDISDRQLQSPKQSLRKLS